MNRTTALALHAIAMISPGALAQWTAIDLHPAGAVASRAFECNQGQVGIRTLMVNGQPAEHACAWNKSAASWVDLHPQGAVASCAFTTFGGRQGGYVQWSGIPYNAAVWSGSSATCVTLHPTGAQSSVVYAITADREGGYVRYDGFERACIWSGTAASRVDLVTAPGTYSQVRAMDDVAQVGSYQARASMWFGTEASRVDLHPVGAEGSYAHGIGGGTQVGYTARGSLYRAAMWRGSADSYVDLHPFGAVSSIAVSTTGAMQAGFVNFGDSSVAAVWHGSAQSWENLHAALPASFDSSVAMGIYTDASGTYVTGSAHDSLTGQHHAILWAMRPTPGCSWQQCPADYNGDGGIDGDDVIAFFADWDTAGSCADVDSSGGVDGDDVIFFFAQWDQGSC